MKQILSAVLLILAEVAAAQTPRVLAVPSEYPTIQAAVDAAGAGDKIVVGPGSYAGASITRPVALIGSGSETRIVSGVPCCGLPSSTTVGFLVQLNQQGPEDAGVSINHFTLESVMYPSMTGMFAGVVARASTSPFYNLDISHNTFRGGYLGIYLLNCNQSNISHNQFVEVETAAMVWAGLITISRNVIAFNTIESDVQGTNAVQWRNVGIWLNAIFGGSITDSRIMDNKIVRTGGTSVYPAFAVFLSAYGAGTDVRQNEIVFNDFRGSENEIGVSAPDLFDRNQISRNLGENRAP
jgi:hypothetical protein